MKGKVSGDSLPARRIRAAIWRRGRRSELQTLPIRWQVKDEAESGLAQSRVGKHVQFQNHMIKLKGHLRLVLSRFLSIARTLLRQYALIYLPLFARIFIDRRACSCCCIHGSYIVSWSGVHLTLLHGT